MCRTYDPIQYAHADILQQSDDVQEIRCNVLLDGLTEGEYTSDFYSYSKRDIVQQTLPPAEITSCDRINLPKCTIHRISGLLTIEVMI